MWFIVGLLSALRVFSTQELSEIAGSDSIVIHWNGSEIPGYSEDIQGYSISCQLRSDRKGKHVVVNRKYFTYPSDSKMATISGLYPGTAYHIGIAAFNKTGYTQSVIVLTVNTLPDPLQPKHFQAKSVSPTVIEATWNSPESDVDSYRLQYINADNNLIYFETLYPPAGYFLLSELTRDTVYKIQLSATSKSNKTLRSVPVYEKTLEYSREECERREKFYCEQYGRCISRLLMCNRNDDCPGKEDETWALCYEEKETCERKGKFRCNITDTCVSLSYLCNGLKQCPNGEDETQPFCSQNLCESRGHFFCSSSQMCLSMDKVCDNVADCAEEEDESAKSCRTPTPTPTTTKLSENLVPDLKGDKNNNNVVLIVLSTVLPVLFVTILVLGSYFYIKKARSLCPMMRPATVSQSERTAMFTRRAASSIRRTRSEVIYMDIDEDVGGMYPCHREEKHEYDKVNDRPPCACLKCVRERVTPMLRSDSVRTRIEPLPTGSLYRRTLKVENNIPTVGINKNGEDRTIPLYLDLDAGNDKLKDFDVNRTESENGKEDDEEVVTVTSQIARSDNKDGSDVKNTSNDYLHPIASTNSTTLTRPKTNLSGEREKPRPKTIHI